MMSKALKKINLADEVLKGGELPTERAKELLKAFGAPFDEAGKLLADYKSIEVTDEKDTEGMKKARETRLALRAHRISIEKKHRELKADSLATGRAIDYVKNTALAEIQPAEEYLLLQEKYAEVLLEKRLAELKEKRRTELLQYTDTPEMYNYMEMDEDLFSSIVAGLKADTEKEEARLAKQAEEEKQAAIKEEKERIAKIQAEMAARKKAEAEALALRKKMEAQEAAARKEREAAEEKLRIAEAQAEAERVHTLKLQQAEAQRVAEEKAQAAAEEKRLADEAAKKAAAPDKEKLLEWIDRLGETDGAGLLNTEKAERISERIDSHFATSLETYRKLINEEL